MALSFDLKVDDGSIKLYINGLLHLLIRRDTLVAVQSWELNGVYSIEFTTTAGPVLCEYFEVGKSRAILELLDKYKLF